MIFAKIDVSFPRHYRIVDVRPECVREPLRRRTKRGPTTTDPCARIARAAALGVWTAVLCYTRDHMLDGFCPLTAINDFAVDEVIDELVRQGLLMRCEQGGREGVVLLNYAKHNETKAEIDRRLIADRARKSPQRGARPAADSDESPAGTRTDSDGIPPPESESESESDPGRELPSQAPARPSPGSSTKRGGDHQALIAHYAAEFERLKGAKPVIGGKGGAGAKKLLEGRTLAEAKAIVDRALSDPWVLDKAPDLASIAGRINAFIGKPSLPSGGSRVPLQPACGSWKKADGFE